MGKCPRLFKSCTTKVDLFHMDARTDQQLERGATLVEYALVFSLIVVGSLLAIDALTTTSGSYLSSTGNDIGEPRDHIEDMSDDLPDPPVWITNP